MTLRLLPKKKMFKKIFIDKENVSTDYITPGVSTLSGILPISNLKHTLAEATVQGHVLF